MTTTSDVRIHPSADVSPRATIGAGSRIWQDVQIREDARIGRNCILGKGVYVDFGVAIGDNCKIQNGAFVYNGATVEDGVFIGPRAVLTNDRLPRAVNPDGSLKSADDWEVGPILIRAGASLGTGAIILPCVTVGRWALVAAGAVVSRDVPDHGLVAGVPARLLGYVCRCGRRLVADGAEPGERSAGERSAGERSAGEPSPAALAAGTLLRCPACGWTYSLPTGTDKDSA
jgi:acetyltransferase-like isoleucine patch superfamily enzyme